MTPLRQRYVDDLRLRNKSPRTIETYVLRVAQFAKHFGRSPATLGPEQLRAYQQHLLARQVSWSMFNQSVCALRFLYNVTLGQPHVITHLPFAKRPRVLPTVLSPEEVLRLFEAAKPGRDRTLLDVTYSCGLRLKELLGLAVVDIDSARMVLHLRHGKGQKERLVPLSPRLLLMLRGYWREYQPATWLFPGIKPSLSLTDGTVQRICKRTARRAGWPSGSILTRCVTVSPRTCWKPVLICCRCRALVGAQPLQYHGQVSAREHAAVAPVAALAGRVGIDASGADVDGRRWLAWGGTEMISSVGPERPALEVADVIREHGEVFVTKYGDTLTDTQRQALRDLLACRTAALGGHVERCLDCGHERVAYNSCRNRHCPKCQALARARWLAREAELLLPVDYYHVVFTLPAELSDLALANPRMLYNHLFQAASSTLRDVAANPKRLGAQMGVLAVLHTWGQNLRHHPHLHCVVTGGGLSCDGQGVVEGSPRWVSCRPGFFLPVRVLSRVFRGKYLELLRAAFDQGQLTFPRRLGLLAEAGGFTELVRPLYKKDWVVYSKAPFGASS